MQWFGKDNLHRIFFGLAAACAIGCAIATKWHYTGKYPGNPDTWLAWLLSLFFLLAAYFPSLPEIRRWAASLWSDKLFVGVFALFALGFVVTHVWNFKTAPWNQNGLFDDAAWDIYFAKTHVFTHEPFQAAFSDGIARETGFHYYITFWFVLFGYNLLTFNLALLLLGLVTFIFTCLIIHELFKNYLVTVVSALVFNFFPFQFIQTFVGHRYAMAGPLITASFYFLITGFSRRSAFRVVVSAILAALCMSSAIMGKQFLMCLVVAVLLNAMTNYKRSITPANVGLSLLFVFGLLVSMIPLIFFIWYNWKVYFGHEQELTALFIRAYKNRASGALNPYLNDLAGIFFAPQSYRRLSMPDYVIIPFWYYMFLLPGAVIALIKKRFGIVLLAVVPVVGAFISTAYDFRVLHAVPFWIILMGFAFHELTRLRKYSRSHAINLAPFAFGACILAAGWVPSVRYLYAKSKDPFSIYLLSQHDVPVGRFLRDIVAGVPHPSTKRKPDEFRRVPGVPEPMYDAFACQETGYGVVHLFLQDYNDKQIMSFCDQLPMLHFPAPAVFAMNKTVLSNYNGPGGVMLIWQQTSRSAPVIAAFRKLGHLGSDRVLVAPHAGRTYTFYVLTVPKENMGQLKRELAPLDL